MSRNALSLLGLLAALASPALVAFADTAPSEAVEQGAKVYFTYCVSCHGVRGDGNGRRAAKLQARPADLRWRYVPDGYIATIIREGGEALGRSSSMPPWQDELSAENIQDLLAYLNSIRLNR